MIKDQEISAGECPVDAHTRAAWLKSNDSKSTKEASLASQRNSCDSSEIDQSLRASSSSPAPKSFFSRFLAPWPSTRTLKTELPHDLALDREISSIPRASPVNNNAEAEPANSEKESGISSSGNWIYPSEKMFFDAMKRKGYHGDAGDMKTIVPIHNAVNEQAWKKIKDWERPWGSEEKCGGPKLHSFLGLSTNLSPKARINTWLGYTAPFDRHDWIVDRCGKKVEYVIDFYAGRNEGKANGKLSFFLDVRPKLNTWEGWKMRGAKLVGLV